MVFCWYECFYICQTQYISATNVLACVLFNRLFRLELDTELVRLILSFVILNILGVVFGRI